MCLCRQRSARNSTEKPRPKTVDAPSMETGAKAAVTTGRVSAAPASITRSSRAKPRRPAWAIYGEKGLEWVIRLCGISAIIFVLSIF